MRVLGGLGEGPEGCGQKILLSVAFLSLQVNRFEERVALEKRDDSHKMLTLPMLRLYFRPKHNDAKSFEKPSRPCHVGIHRIALVEYSQMSTHVPGFQIIFQVFCMILY